MLIITTDFQIISCIRLKTCGVFTYKRFCDQSGPYSRTGILEKGIELRVSGLRAFFKTPKLKQGEGHCHG